MILFTITITISILIFSYFYLNKIIIEDVSSKAVLITGSGTGFGRALVEKCLSEGMTVFAGCRREESAKNLSDELKVASGHLEAFQMDVTSQQSVSEALDYVVKQLKEMNKELYAVVNNAGTQGNCLFDDFLNLDDYRTTVEVNTFGAIRVTHAFKDLIKRSRGRFIFCSSSVVRFPTPGMGSYAVSKWAITAYANVLRHELYDFNVKVSVLEPGFYHTPMNSISRTLDMINRVWSRANQNLKNEYGEYWLSKNKRVFMNVWRKSPSNITPVTNAYFHALTAKYPHRNYTIGLDAIIIYRPFSWCPPLLQELLMRGITRFVGVPIPASVDTNNY